MPSRFVRPLWTGLRDCYDPNGKIIPCKDSGQDAELSPVKEWPNPRFEALGDVVQDRLTALFWTRDASVFGFLATWKEAISYIAKMNEECALGRSDWRLPNRRELRSLLDLGTKKPSLPISHPFKNVFNGWYWTSTTFSGFKDYAWWIHMEGARMFYGRKDQYAMFWPVAGREKGVLLATGQRRCYDETGQEIPCQGTGQDGEYRYGHWINGDELRFEPLDALSVLDHLTGLVWTRDANLSLEPVSWQEAFLTIRHFNRVAGGGWRLPTINELESLVDCAHAFPALSPKNPFKGLQEVYWSSTTSFYEPDWAWALYLGKGATGVGKKGSARFSVWAVKG